MLGSIVLVVAIVLGTIAFVPFPKFNPAVFGIGALCFFSAYILVCAALAFFTVSSACINWSECYYDAFSVNFYLPYDALMAIGMVYDYLSSRGAW